MGKGEGFDMVRKLIRRWLGIDRLEADVLRIYNLTGANELTHFAEIGDSLTALRARSNVILKFANELNQLLIKHNIN